MYTCVILDCIWIRFVFFCISNGFASFIPGSDICKVLHLRRICIPSAQLGLCPTSLSRRQRLFTAFFIFIVIQHVVPCCSPFFPAICHHHFTHLRSQRVVASVITARTLCGY
ncbi:hypothetical protein BDR03DRAFT_947340 [Suillus americanus]|nr:hypothetical protein BDR03DRAFT_947340 [Suillus americanus]